MAERESPPSMGDRIRLVRERSGYDSQTDFGRRLGVSRQAVSAWETNLSHPGAKMLGNIALLTNSNYDWIATGRGSIKPPTLEIVGAPIVGVVEAGVWQTGKSIKDNLASGENMGFVPGLPDTELAGIEQFSVQVEGTGANLSVQPNEYCVCLNFNDARPNGPHPGDLVVMLKRRASDGSFEQVIGRLHLIDGCWQAHYESTDRRWIKQPPIRFNDELNLDLNDNTPIEILGCVMGAFRYNPQPVRVEGPHQAITTQLKSVASAMLGMLPDIPSPIPTAPAKEIVN